MYKKYFSKYGCHQKKNSNNSSNRIKQCIFDDIINRKKSIKKITFCLFFNTVFFICFTGCSLNEVKSGNSLNEEKTQPFTRNDFVMDTVLSETVYGTEDVTKEIQEKLSDLEKKQLSWRVEDSEISKVNAACQNGESIKLDTSLYRFMKSALKLAKKSEGAFDPTIGELTRLWNIEGENPAVPAQKEIKRCLSHTGYDKVYLDQTTKVLTVEEEMNLDLGAVGKGIGCDVVEEYLSSEEKVSGAVVAIGGSVLVHGQKEDGADWKVAVQDPREEDGNAMGVLKLSGTHFISTSGDYEKYFMENGKRYHHILDPSTGYPAESGLISVTIVCDNGLLSDGLSTACFILGEEKGKALLKEYGAEGIFIDDKKNVTVTEGLEESFSILNEEYTLL